MLINTTLHFFDTNIWYCIQYRHLPLVMKGQPTSHSSSKTNSIIMRLSSAYSYLMIFNKPTTVPGNINKTCWISPFHCVYLLHSWTVVSPWQQDWVSAGGDSASHLWNKAIRSFKTTSHFWSKANRSLIISIHHIIGFVLQICKKSDLGTWKELEGVKVPNSWWIYCQMYLAHQFT